MLCMGSSQAILKLKCERLLKTFCTSYYSEKCPSEPCVLLNRILKKCHLENEAIFTWLVGWGFIYQKHIEGPTYPHLGKVGQIYYTMV